MALIKTGAIVPIISGKVGGQTFGNGKSGNYLKNTGSYINKTTPNRKRKNFALSAITALWKFQDPLDQASWSALSPSLPYVNRVGDTAYYSGFNLFTQFNYNVVLTGKTPLKTAPALSALSPPSAVDIAFSGGKIFITTTGGDNDVFGKVYLSAGISPGSNQYKSSRRLVTVDSNAALKASLDVTSLFETVFGPYIPEMKYFVHVEFFDSNTGQPLGSFLNDWAIAK